MDQKSESRVLRFVKSHEEELLQAQDHNVVFLAQFQRNESYRESLQILADYLALVNQDLFNFAVDLGLSGEWKLWDRLQPPGSSVTISDESLYNVQDKYVRLIMLLKTEIQDAEGVVRSKIGKMK